MSQEILDQWSYEPGFPVIRRNGGHFVRITAPHWYVGTSTTPSGGTPGRSIATSRRRRPFAVVCGADRYRRLRSAGDLSIHLCGLFVQIPRFVLSGGGVLTRLMLTGYIVTALPENILAVLFLRRYGLLAPITMRLGEYLVWHIMYSNFPYGIVFPS